MNAARAPFPVHDIITGRQTDESGNCEFSRRELYYVSLQRWLFTLRAFELAAELGDEHEASGRIKRRREENRNNSSDRAKSDSLAARQQCLAVAREVNRRKHACRSVIVQTSPEGDQRTATLWTAGARISERYHVSWVGHSSGRWICGGQRGDGKRRPGEPLRTRRGEPNCVLRGLGPGFRVFNLCCQFWG